MFDSQRYSMLIGSEKMLRYVLVLLIKFQNLTKGFEVALRN